MGGRHKPGNRKRPEKSGNTYKLGCRRDRKKRQENYRNGNYTGSITGFAEKISRVEFDRIQETRGRIKKRRNSLIPAYIKEPKYNNLIDLISAERERLKIEIRYLKRRGDVKKHVGLFSKGPTPNAYGSVLNSMKTRKREINEICKPLEAIEKEFTQLQKQQTAVTENKKNEWVEKIVFAIRELDSYLNKYFPSIKIER
ncbi:MAG: hypothetical protein ABIA76_00880 [Candidatus Diapherotrites archaeon]